MHSLGILFSGVALLLASFMAWTGRGRRALPGCGAGSPCDALSRGRWSRLGGVRVVYLGLVVYAILFVSATANQLLDDRSPSWLPATITTSAVIAIGAAAWFFGLQALVLRRWCPWCLLTHLAGLGAGAMILHPMTIHDLGRLPVLIGFAGVGLLVMGQLLVRPKLYDLVQIPPAEAPSAAPPARTSAASVEKVHAANLETAAAAPAPETRPAVPIANMPATTSGAFAEPLSRPETFFRGRITLDVNRWPILGRPDARHLLVYFYDYTCHQCRLLHSHLLHMLEIHPNDLAFVCVPTPMETRCNWALQSQDPRHLHACQYAQYALAVWLSDESKFEEFDRWLFDPAVLPGVDAARRKAEQLIGADRFAEALGYDGVSQRIREGIQAYLTGGAGPIPQILFRESLFLGEVPGLAIMSKLIEHQLGLAPSALPSPVKRDPAPPQAPPGVYIVNIDPRKTSGEI